MSDIAFLPLPSLFSVFYIVVPAPIAFSWTGVLMALLPVSSKRVFSCYISIYELSLHDTTERVFPNDHILGLLFFKHL